MRSSIRIGTRASALALVQSEAIAGALREVAPDVAVELVRIRTSGDRIQDRSLAEIGGKALFVKEIEEAILSGAVDCGVHSMKDVPGILPEGLEIVAVPTRADPRDVLVWHGRGGLAALRRGARVGTSSPRRAALALAARPDLQVLPIRGNVETRLAKWRGGQVDALLLASAGLSRLGIELEETTLLEPEEMLPAVGQGALAIEARVGDEFAGLHRQLEDLDASRAAAAERALLAGLGGDCKTPIAAFATLEASRLRLRAIVASPDGRRTVAGESFGGLDEGAALGAALAEELLTRGAREILARARR